MPESSKDSPQRFLSCLLILPFIFLPLVAGVIIIADTWPHNCVSHTISISMDFHAIHYNITARCCRWTLNSGEFKYRSGRASLGTFEALGKSEWPLTMSV